MPSKISEKTLASYGVTPEIKEQLTDAGFVFYLPPRLELRQLSQTFHLGLTLDPVIRWTETHKEEGSLYPDVLTPPQKESLLAVDFRQRPSLNKRRNQIYPDDEDFMGPIIGHFKGTGKIPKLSVSWGMKEVHLSPESRFGLTAHEVRNPILAHYQKQLKEVFGLEELVVRLPRVYEYLCLLADPLEEMEWLRGEVMEEDCGVGTYEWCNDRFRDDRFSLGIRTNINPDLGYLIFGRDQEGIITVCWNSSTQDSGNKTSYLGFPRRASEVGCHLGFRPVIEFSKR